MLLCTLLTCVSSLTVDTPALEIVGGLPSRGLLCHEPLECEYPEYVAVPHGLEGSLHVAYESVDDAALFAAPPQLMTDGSNATLTFSLHPVTGYHHVSFRAVLTSMDATIQAPFTLTISPSRSPEVTYVETGTMTVFQGSGKTVSQGFAQATGGFGVITAQCVAVDTALFVDLPGLVFDAAGLADLTFAVGQVPGATTVTCTVRDMEGAVCTTLCPITLSVIVAELVPVLVFNPTLPGSSGEHPTVTIRGDAGRQFVKLFDTIHLPVGSSQNIVDPVKCTASSEIFDNNIYINSTTGVLSIEPLSVAAASANLSCTVLVNGAEKTTATFEVVISTEEHFVFQPTTYPVMRVGESSIMGIAVSIAPQDELVLSLNGGDCVRFEPTNVVFTTDVITAAVIVTCTCSGEHMVVYTLSGPVSGSYVVPFYPNVVQVVDSAWGLRFSKTSHVPKSTYYMTALPEVVVELTDSAGRHDTSSAHDIVIIAEASHGRLHNSVVTMIDGRAAFNDLMFADHPVNPVLSFKASSASAPVDGKALSSGIIAVVPLAAYSMRFVEVSAVTDLVVTVRSPLPRVVVELLNSDDTKDIATAGVTVSALSSNGGQLSGNIAVFGEHSAGRAIFTDLQFLNIPDRPVVTFIAEGEGRVVSSVLKISVMTVLQAVCNVNDKSTECTCTGALEGSYCDDSSASTLADICTDGICRGSVLHGYQADASVVTSGLKFSISIYGSRLPTQGTPDMLWVSSSADCSAAPWPGGGAVHMLPTPSNSVRRTSNLFTLTSASQTPLTVCYDIDGVGLEPPIAVPYLSDALVIVPSVPVITAVQSASCLKSSSVVFVHECRDGEITIAGQHFDTMQKKTRVILTRTGFNRHAVCEVRSLSKDQVVCDLKVPPSASGNWLMVVGVLDVLSDPVPIGLVSPTPVVHQLVLSTCLQKITNVESPLLNGCRPGVLSIVGAHFDNVKPSMNVVTFVPSLNAEGVPPSCQVFASSDTTLECEMQADDGTVGAWIPLVTVNGIQSMGSELGIVVTLEPPVLTAMTSPTCMGGGLEVVDCTGVLNLIGKGFDGQVPENNIITLEGSDVTCRPVNTEGWSDTHLACMLHIPSNAHGAWQLTVRVTGPHRTPVSSNVGTIRVNPKLVIDSVTTNCPFSPCTGDTLTLFGSNFATDALVNVVAIFGGTAPNGMPTCTPFSVIATTSGTMRLVCRLAVTPSTSGVWNVQVAVEQQVSNTQTIALQSAPPTITALQMDTCEISSPFSLNGCSDGNLVISGENFDPREEHNSITFTLGSGQPPFCASVKSGANGVLVCSLSAAAGTSGSWKVVVEAGSLKSTTVAVVSLKLAVPIVSEMEGAGCVEEHQGSWTQCTGGLLKLHGAHFGANTADNVVSFVREGADLRSTPKCAIEHSSTRNTLICVLSAPAGVAGVWHVVVTSYGLSSAKTITLSMISAPVILRLASDGCSTAGALSLHYCSGGDLLRVSGSSFDTILTNNAVELHSSGATLVCQVTKATTTELQCMLPVLHGVYSLTVFVNGVVAATSAMLSSTSAFVPVIHSVVGGGCQHAGFSLGECVGGALTVRGSALTGMSEGFISSVELVEGDGHAPVCTLITATEDKLECALDIAGARGSWNVNLVVRDSLGNVQYTSKEVVHMTVSRTPDLTLINGGGCTHVSTTSLTGCTGGILNVVGVGFNTIAIGQNVVVFSPTSGNGHAPLCEVQSSTSTTLRCALTVPAGSTAVWQLRVSNDGGYPSLSATPPIISVAATVPTVAKISGGGCSSGGAPASSSCKGGILTIEGDHFVPVHHMNTVRLVSEKPGNPPKCVPIPQGSSITSLKCQLSSPENVSSNEWTVIVDSVGVLGTSFVVLTALYAPAVFNTSGGGCIGQNTQCAGGPLLLIGDNFSPPATVQFVGGEGAPPECNVSSVFSTSLSCDLVVHPGTHGTWRVTVVSDGVASTHEDVPSLQIVSPPIVQQVSGGGCLVVINDTHKSCNGGLLVITGQYFLPNYTRVDFVPLAGQAMKPTCTGFDTTETTLRCTLSVPSAAAGNWQLIVVSQTAVAQYTPVLEAVPNPPIIHALEGGGCTGTGFALSSCKGGHLVIVGEWFHVDSAKNSVVFSGGAGDLPSCAITRVTETEIECDLGMPPGTSGVWVVQVISGHKISVRMGITLEAAPELVIMTIEKGGCESVSPLSLTQCTGTNSMDTRNVGGNLVISCNLLSPSPEATSVVFSGPDPVPTCDIVSVTKEAVTCRLLISQVMSKPWQVTIYNKGLSSTNTATVRPYISPSPLITSAEGSCEARNKVQPSSDLVLCRSGMLTIHGRNFHPFAAERNAIVAIPEDSSAKANPGLKCVLTTDTMWLTQITCNLKTQGAAGKWKLQLGSSSTGILLEVFSPLPANEIRGLGPSIEVVLSYPVEAFDPDYWRYLCARTMTSLFGMAISEARVAVVAVKEGSTYLTFSFTEGSGTELTAAELSSEFRKAAGDPRDTTGLRGLLGVVELPSTPMPSEEGDTSWFEQNWWVVVLACVLLISIFVAIGCVYLPGNGANNDTECKPSPECESKSLPSDSYVNREVTPPNPLREMFQMESVDEASDASQSTDPRTEQSGAPSDRLDLSHANCSTDYTPSQYTSRVSYYDSPISSRASTRSYSYTESYISKTESYISNTESYTSDPGTPQVNYW